MDPDRKDPDRADLDRTPDEPDTEPVTEPERPVEADKPMRKARTSLLAVLGLMVGLTAPYLALTGFGRVAIAVGFLGVILGAAGMSATAAPHRTGRWVALLGLLLALGGLVLGLAVTIGAVPALEPGNDPVTHARDWLHSRLPWAA